MRDLIWAFESLLYHRNIEIEQIVSLIKWYEDYPDEFWEYVNNKNKSKL